MTSDMLRQQIADLVARYAEQAHAPQPFVPGESVIPPSGKVIGARELQFMVDAALDGWLTTGRFNAEFEKGLADFLGVKHLITVNSGSSANLVAFSTLTSPKLGERAIRKGDEVIGVAAGFPTTVNPIAQFGNRQPLSKPRVRRVRNTRLLVADAPVASVVLDLADAQVHCWAPSPVQGIAHEGKLLPLGAGRVSATTDVTAITQAQLISRRPRSLTARLDCRHGRSKNIAPVNLQIIHTPVCTNGSRVYQPTGTAPGCGSDRLPPHQ